MGHAYVSIGSTPLKILCVCTTPEPALPFPSDQAAGQARVAALPAVKGTSASRVSREHAASNSEARPPHKGRRRR